MTKHAPATLPGEDGAGTLVVRGSQPTPISVASQDVREPRQSVPTADCRGNSHNRVGRHSPVHTKLSDELRDYLANQPRLVLIGVNGVARPFFHLPFHAQPDSQGS